jgi:hypothetical protein
MVDFCRLIKIDRGFLSINMSGGTQMMESAWCVKGDTMWHSLVQGIVIAWFPGETNGRVSVSI